MEASHLFCDPVAVAPGSDTFKIKTPAFEEGET